MKHYGLACDADLKPSSPTSLIRKQLNWDLLRTCLARGQGWIKTKVRRRGVKDITWVE